MSKREMLPVLFLDGPMQGQTKWLPPCLRFEASQGFDGPAVRYFLHKLGIREGMTTVRVAWFASTSHAPPVPAPEVLWPHLYAHGRFSEMSAKTMDLMDRGEQQ